MISLLRAKPSRSHEDAGAMTTLLLIDDDAKLAAHLTDFFAQYKWTLLSAQHPQDGLQLLQTEKPDAVILDVMMPDMDGFEVCRRIRQRSDIPVIMLTARGEVMDRVVGLELGADDYLAKPFEPRELVVRIQNILKRVEHRPAQGKLNFKHLTIDSELRQVTVKGKTLHLTTMEYQLLLLLASSPLKNFTRDEILNELKGIEVELLSRSVDIAISRLRKKLSPLDYIKTVWGAGYSFVPEQAQD